MAMLDAWKNGRKSPFLGKHYPRKTNPRNGIFVVDDFCDTRTKWLKQFVSRLGQGIGKITGFNSPISIKISLTFSFPDTMVGRSISRPQSVQDTLDAHVRKPKSGKFALERHNFMSSKLMDMYREFGSRGLVDKVDSEEDEMDLRKIFKDIDRLGSSHMSWKERKELENRNIVALGGKPPKKYRLPINIAKGIQKKQKKRECKMLQEGLIHGQFGKHVNKFERRRPEERALKTSQGHFRNGVLNVSRLMGPAKSIDGDNEQKNGRRGQKGKWKKHKGKKCR